MASGSPGPLGDVDASKASERPILFLVTIAGLTAALVWLRRYDPTSFLIRGLVVTGAFMIVAAVLTRWIKLSLHVAFAALTATALCGIGSPIGWALAALVPVVAWARLVLARHSVGEVLMGFVLGVVTGCVLIWG